MTVIGQYGIRWSILHASGRSFTVVLACVWIATMAMVGLFADLVSPYDPLTIDLHGRLAPPPLEDVTSALSTEEVRLLTAAPPEPEPEPEPEPTSETEAETAEQQAPAPDVETPDDTDTEKAATQTPAPPQAIITGEHKSAG